MKKMSSFIILFLLLIGLYGCRQNGETLKKITIDSIESNSETLVIEDANTIEKIKAAVEKAEKNRVEEEISE
ncbi:hypothetical protein [Metabacillus malikii]|uniref:Uncharacterized protein n=1 Tax=Metabacillus malikii TaxID=1504265 RepID=A0ABT9ZJZ7_9BACI|nr:hypothetical protein [Metabacillus malikii]MDQ0232592.1 hypothetical protein [Metabacillus malikii]